MKNLNVWSKIGAALFLTISVANSAIAGIPTTQVPEPSMLSLIAVVGVVMYVMRKRK